jgi:hypothetical protein
LITYCRDKTIGTCQGFGALGIYVILLGAGHSQGCTNGHIVGVGDFIFVGKVDINPKLLITVMLSGIIGKTIPLFNRDIDLLNHFGGRGYNDRILRCNSFSMRGGNRFFARGFSRGAGEKLGPGKVASHKE